MPPDVPAGPTTSDRESATVDLDALAGAVTAALPALGATERRLALATYAQLSAGLPATADAVARRVGLPETEVANQLARLPTARHDAGAVVAFLGLQLAPTVHRIRFAGPEVATWCAWDTLFLPALVGRTAAITSRCPVTGTAITLELDPVSGIADLAPATARLTFLAAPAPYAGNLVASFCRFVHFVADEHAADAFLAKAAGNDGERLVTLRLEDGLELGRRTNARIFG